VSLLDTGSTVSLELTDGGGGGRLVGEGGDGALVGDGSLTLLTLLVS
jgi:hypothetical protein